MRAPTSPSKPRRGGRKGDGRNLASPMPDGLDLRRIINVVERVGLKDEEIGPFSGRQRSAAIGVADRFRGVVSGADERLQRREAGFDQSCNSRCSAKPASRVGIAPESVPKLSVTPAPCSAFTLPSAIAKAALFFAVAGLSRIFCA